MTCILCGAQRLAFMHHCAACAAMLANIDDTFAEIRRAADESRHFEMIDEHRDDGGAAWEPDEPYFGPEEAL